MTDRPSLVERLRRARIVQVLVVYLGASWAVLQVADLLQSGLDLPEWVMPVSVILLLIGPVIILATAWVQALPSTTAKEEAGEVPSDWEIAPKDAVTSLLSGELPHLTWGRSILGGAVALSLCFGVAGLYVMMKGPITLGPEEAGADEAATGIAVVPFSVSGEDLDVWREGMVDLLSTNLDGLGGFRAIDSRTVLARWRSSVGDAPDADLGDALRVAGATGARYALVGSAVSLGGRVRLTGEVYDVADGEKIGQAQVEGQPGEVLSLADGLAVAVVRELLGSEGSQVVSRSQVASLSTSSVEALRSYLEGESLIRGGEFERAASAYEEAVDRDSTFASAYYRLTSTYGWMEAGGDRAERAELALRALSENLPPRDRLLLEGEEALATGDPDGIRLMEEAVKRYPDDPDAWAMLGELYVHGGARVFRTPADVHRAYGSAVERDPTFGPNYIHYAESTIQLGREDEARALLATYLGLAPDTHQGRALQLAVDASFGSPEERAAALSALPDETVHTTSDMINGLPLTSAGLDAYQAVGDVNWARTRGGRWAWVRVWTRIARGRLNEARDLLEEDDSDARRVSLGWVLSLAMPEDGRPTLDPSLCGGSAECLLVSGVQALEDGDDGRAEVARRGFRESLAEAQEAGNEGWAAWLQAGSDGLEAYGSWLEEAPRDAERALREIQLRPEANGTLSDRMRLWLGQIAAQEDRIEDAREYFTSLAYADLGWYGVLEEARALHQAGDVASEDAYRRFLELWSDAPADHPFVVEARQDGGG
jgi:tetratricopeptide (TPR) repeat protein/TolB-like protein